jgi:hypothetical protein
LICTLLHVLWADSLRWQGFRRALDRPDRPDFSDPQIGGPLARRLALEGFDEAPRPTSRPGRSNRLGSSTSSSTRT